MTPMLHTENIGYIMHLSIEDIDRIIEMAWEDRTPFEAIEMQFQVSESEVIEIMRKHMKRTSFKMWRKRVSGRATKHIMLRTDSLNEDSRFKCSRQRSVSNNKISKRA